MVSPKPSTVPASQKVDDHPIRRKFAPEYKLRILQEIDARRGEGRGVVGEVLRREGLFASQVASWKNSLQEVIAHGFPEKKRGRKKDAATHYMKAAEKLEKRLKRIEEENRQLRLIVAAQKKIAEMFPDQDQDQEMDEKNA